MIRRNLHQVRRESRSTTIFWLFSVLISSSAFLNGCVYSVHKGVATEMTEVNVQNGWEVTVYGEVTHVNVVDLDKSGRNPKNVMRINMTIERIEGLESTIGTSSHIIFQASEADVLLKLGRSPEAGDHLVVESFTREREPQILPIYSIKTY